MIYYISTFSTLTTRGLIPWGLLVQKKRYRPCDSNKHVDVSTETLTTRGMIPWGLLVHQKRYITYGSNKNVDVSTETQNIIHLVVNASVLM
jgi:hypothetical protein